MRAAFLSLLTWAWLAGCASNPYQVTYTPQVHPKVPRAEPAALLPPSGAPELLGSQDLRADSIRLLENGYRPIGRSSFKGSRVDAGAALEQALAVGADLVLVMQKHVGSSTYAQPVHEWIPDRRIVTQETVANRSSDSEKVDYQTRQSVTTIEGEYAVRYVPQSVDTYDHTATYWRRAPAPVLGLMVSELSEEERKAIQSNRGVSVRVVTRRSPAFLADVFRGDIVRRVGTHDVVGADDFFEQVMDQAGKTLDLELWREGKTLKKRVTLARP